MTTKKQILLLIAQIFCIVCAAQREEIIKEETKRGKQSLRINLTEHRLQLIDPLNHERGGIEIHDLINDSGCNEGTCVDIKIPVTYM